MEHASRILELSRRYRDLTAANLSELVTHSLTEYETLALKLAHDQTLLRSLRKKLEQDRLHLPLFDTSRFARNLERVFQTMGEIAQRGEPPQSFTIGPQ